MSLKTLFFLNESVPLIDEQLFSSKLEDVITIYIRQLMGKPVEGVFHTRGSDYDWSKFFDRFKDYTVRSRAYRLFSTRSKMPVDEAELLSVTAHTYIDSKRIDEPFCYIAASLTDGFLFTVPTLRELEQDTLPLILGNESESRVILNYHGSNADFVLHEIEQRRQSGLSNLSKLRDNLPAVFEEQFSHSFEKLSTDAQDEIVFLFMKLKSQKYKTQKEGPGMREITMGSGRERLYELKIFWPAAIRVYFTIKQQVVYLASVGDKATQSRDIAAAQKYLDAWLRE